MAKSAIPLGYAFCLEKNCVQAENCLRSVKFKEFCAQEHRSSFNIVNPEDCNPQQKKCINFRSTEPAPYAFGFTNEYQKMNNPFHRCFMFLRVVLQYVLCRKDSRF